MELSILHSPQLSSLPSSSRLSNSFLTIKKPVDGTRWREKCKCWFRVKMDTLRLLTDSRTKTKSIQHVTCLVTYEETMMHVGQHSLAWLPLLSPSPSSCFWAAQSRMRLILPMSLLQCGGSAFILAERWPVNILTSQSGRDLPLLPLAVLIIHAVNEIIK